MLYLQRFLYDLGRAGGKSCGGMLPMVELHTLKVACGIHGNPARCFNRTPRS